MSPPVWHEDDSFWAETGSALFTQERIQEAGTEVAHTLALTKPPQGACVLDLGCGIGRHTLEFARRGFRVTGVDRTASYLQQAMERTKAEGLEIEWLQADMREFRRDASFDLAVNLLTSFGYFEDPAEDRRVAENVLASLTPAGNFVIELMGKEILARIFRSSDWQKQQDGTILLEERKVIEDWSRLDMRWIVIKDKDRYDRRFQLRLYAASELKRLLQDAGFTHVAAYGSLEGKPYDHTSERLVVVGRK